MTAPLVLTMGDPAGIGPELAIKAWTQLQGSIPFVVIGDAPLLSASVPIKKISTPGDLTQDALCVIDVPLRDGLTITPGRPEPKAANAIINWIKTAVELVQSGAASAVVTNPINKKVLVDGAAFPHPGHTEFLAALDGRDTSVMMLAGPDLRVVPVTVHIAIADVPTALTASLIAETAKITHDALVADFGIAKPRIAVAGLNPHAGEGGLMGTEDDAIIAPVIAQLASQGMDIRGPMSADTMFHEAARATYDAALCMYHDQALIPLKTLAFSDGVNATLGLSFVRTSPDHGTAYDIAGTGKADAQSLIAALRMAHDMAARRG